MVLKLFGGRSGKEMLFFRSLKNLKRKPNKTPARASYYILIILCRNIETPGSECKFFKDSSCLEIRNFYMKRQVKTIWREGAKYSHVSPHPSLSGSNLKKQCNFAGNNLLDWKLILCHGSELHERAGFTWLSETPNVFSFKAIMIIWGWMDNVTNGINITKVAG